MCACVQALRGSLTRKEGKDENVGEEREEGVKGTKQGRGKRGKMKGEEGWRAT